MNKPLDTSLIGSDVIQSNRLRHTITRWAFTTLTWMTCLCALSGGSLQAAPPVPWDYKPYKVLVWIVVDDEQAIDIDGLSQTLKEYFYRSPGAAWSVEVQMPPKPIRTTIYRRFETLTYDDITARDYVLAMKRNHVFASTVRSIDSAAEKLAQIPGDSDAIDTLAHASDEIPTSNWRSFLDSCSFDEKGQLLIAGGDPDGSDVIVYFGKTFIVRLHAALEEGATKLADAAKKYREKLDESSPDERKRIEKILADSESWIDIAQKLQLDDEQRLYLVQGEDQRMEITPDVILQAIRKAIDSGQSWSDFAKMWKVDEDDNLHMQLAQTEFFLPLPNRVFKDFYLKTSDASGQKTPDGAVGLDKQQEFVKQQILMDKLRELLVSGNGWTKFGSRLLKEPKGVLYLESQWSVGEGEEVIAAARREGKTLKNSDLMDAMILPRGVAMGLVPEAKIIDPQIPGAIAPQIESPDKIFFVKVTSADLPYQVQVREMDCPMRLMGPIVSGTANAPEVLADVIADNTLTAFAPIVRLENVGKNSAKGRVRAGGLLVTRDKEGKWVLDESSPAAITPQDVLQPVIRRLDQNKNPTMLEVVDFAFLVADKLDSARLDMKAYAGRVGTLQGRTDRRTTRNALKIRPYYKETVVRLHVQGDPTKPLTGYELYSKSFDSLDMNLIGRTDYDGRIWIEKCDQPLLLLYVKNGNVFPAKLPLVPGQSMVEVADIPGDETRLRAEAYLKGIENQIVDLVAQRKLAAYRIRGRLEKGDVQAAKELYDEVASLPDYNDIAKDMDLESAIIKTDDRRQQPAINKMFDATKGTLASMIGDGLIAELQADIIAVEAGKPMPSKLKDKEAAEEQSKKEAALQKPDQVKPAK